MTFNYSNETAINDEMNLMFGDIALQGLEENASIKHLIQEYQSDDYDVTWSGNFLEDEYTSEEIFQEAAHCFDKIFHSAQSYMRAKVDEYTLTVYISKLGACFRVIRDSSHTIIDIRSLQITCDDEEDIPLHIRFTC